MERFTEWDEYGNADIIALSNMMPELYAELSFSESNALTDVLNRLAAYEDTGLLPEEATDVVRCKECKHLMFSDCYGECGIGHMGIVMPDHFCGYGEKKG